MRHRPVGLLRSLARGLRGAPTPTERQVWSFLRHRKCLGFRFKRQVVIEGLIVDFYCRELRLAVELDGAVHHTPSGIERDRARDAHLHARGIRVLHLRNEDATPARILAEVTDLSRRPPSPRAGEQGYE